MRIQRLRIRAWRNFENVDFQIPADAPLVCLIGGNGTGKSQILEVIASAAHRIGLAQGFEGRRGDPFAEASEIEIEFFLTPDALPGLELLIEEDAVITDSGWDRTLTVRSQPGHSTKVTAGGVSPERAEAVATRLADRMRASELVHYLMLDADRAYPRLSLNVNQIGEAFQTNWEGERKSKSHHVTKTLYDEWFRYLIGTENKISNRHISNIRLARDKGLDEPLFVDPMVQYRDAIREVLPHLLFVGVNSQTRQINFDSNDTVLTFDQLSGGEREIAFLIGQIDRFALRTGLLLVDEPELHLNYDLLRSWIAFLKRSVEAGQVWLASHSLEVVEVTGPSSTILLERDETTRKVVSATTLEAKPVIATLSRAVGSPGFSIANLRFVFIEGESSLGERERFRQLCSAAADVRFMEGGSCSEVIRRMADLRSIAEASADTIRLGGVIDGDWRSRPERDRLNAEGAHVLSVHEVENFFLHPPTVESLISALGQDPSRYRSSLLAAADNRAGAWIFDAARTQKEFREYPPPSEEVRVLAHASHWTNFATNLDATCQALVDAQKDLLPEQALTLLRHLKCVVRFTGDIAKVATSGKSVRARRYLER